MDEKKYELELVSGVEGSCVYLNSYRVAGPKPWGGGQVTRSWRVTGRDLLAAVPDLLAAERARIRKELEELLDLQETYDPAFLGEYRQGLLNGNERAVDAIRRGLKRICPAQETTSPSTTSST